jgi:predicted ribosome quality control (RQC) complex YloA/Tae2 family protein
MNQAAESYYRMFLERQHYNALKRSLLSTLNARLSKLTKKRQHLQTQQNQIERAEDYKHKGELLTTYLYQLKKGMQEAKVVDYYTEEQQTITIALDPRLTPAQNAQRYFKRYTKLKQGKDVTMQRLQETEQQIAHFEEWKFFIEEAKSLERLKELHTEFQEFDGVRQKQSRKRQHAPRNSSRPFLRIVSSDGFDIYVGRSSKENDQLTQRTALPDDIWLHVYQAPGSHVVILNRNRNRSVPDSTLHEAASLAAYHSKLRDSGKVDVMYTPKKYVKKPKGSPPGLVTVSRFKTIQVVPKQEVPKVGSA